MNNFLHEVISTPLDICAVITTYRPEDGMSERVERIRRNVGLVVIVDDGESAENVKVLKNWFANKQKVIIHHNIVNAGIAAALNNGVSIAKRKGYRWVLTLDDDTIVKPDMVNSLIKMWRFAAAQGGKPVAIMGMENSGEHADKVVFCAEDSPTFVEKRGIITSGSLMSLDTHDVIGPFREEFFVDSVDYDYCMRARAKGYRVIKICQVGMTHSLGRPKEYDIGWFKVQTTNHSAVRRYYMYRNSTVLAREHFLRDPLYSFAVFLFQLKTWFIVLFLEEDKYMKFRYMFRGILHGWRKHLGKVVLDYKER